MSNTQSPCLDICSLDRTKQYCVGCGRSLEEIATWQTVDDAERRAIIEKLPERLQRLKD